MKKSLFIIFLLGIVLLRPKAQTSIVDFPSSLGTVEYGKVADVPKLLHEAVDILYQTEIDGIIIAEYYFTSGRHSICAFDQDMNVLFPTKEFLVNNTYFIGVNNNQQIIVVKETKKGAEITLLDKHLQLIDGIAKVQVPNLLLHRFYKDGKIYYIARQKNAKPYCWIGYVVDANTLSIESQTILSYSEHTSISCSPDKEYVGVIAADETKGMFLDLLHNGANIKLFDKNFRLINERYVHGNQDDPYFQAYDEKTRKKLSNNMLTHGDVNLQVGNDGVLRYITLDGAYIMTTQGRVEYIPVHNNRISLYTLSADRNDSISIDGLMMNKVLMPDQTLLNATDSSIIMLAWYRNDRNNVAADGYSVLNWNIFTKELSTTEKELFYPARWGNFNVDKVYCKRVYNYERGVLATEDKEGVFYYYMIGSKEGDVSFPCILASTTNNPNEVGFLQASKPVSNRKLVARSDTKDIFCFLVEESLNCRDRIYPEEVTKPLYLEFISKNGKIGEYIFPYIKKVSKNLGEGVGWVHTSESSLIVDAEASDDGSIHLYIQHIDKKMHQWVTLHPAYF